jgi:hypothetical protein
VCAMVGFVKWLPLRGLVVVKILDVTGFSIIRYLCSV